MAGNCEFVCRQENWRDVALCCIVHLSGVRQGFSDIWITEDHLKAIVHTCALLACFVLDILIQVFDFGGGFMGRRPHRPQSPKLL